MWLFSSASKNITVPKLNFEDYLGRGFSGDIFGRKAKVKSLSLGEYNFSEVIAAFPDSLSLANVMMVKDRLGSIGGAVLKRFDVIFNYENQKMYLRENKYFKEKFHYNTTGITIQHSGVQVYKEEIPMQTLNTDQESHYKQLHQSGTRYNFKLLPKYEILDVRKNSVAEKAGIKRGDVLISINGTKAYRLSLNRVNNLLEPDSNKLIKIGVIRNSQELFFEFKTVNLL